MIQSESVHKVFVESTIQFGIVLLYFLVLMEIEYEQCYVLIQINYILAYIILL